MQVIALNSSLTYKTKIRMRGDAPSDRAAKIDLEDSHYVLDPMRQMCAHPLNNVQHMRQDSRATSAPEPVFKLTEAFLGALDLLVNQTCEILDAYVVDRVPRILPVI